MHTCITTSINECIVMLRVQHLLKNTVIFYQTNLAVMLGMAETFNLIEETFKPSQEG